MDEREIIGRIHALVDEEDTLRQRQAHLDEQERSRIEQIEVALDQCWDLLRQRRARREFGEDEGTAHVRDESTVEGYVQ
jgi:Protein of unknown function (DUF2630)